MQAFNIGISGLSVDQAVLDLIGQNIANANTPGYHRQVADLSSRNFGLPIGDGVALSLIRQNRDDLLETALTQNTVEAQDIGTQLTSLNQVQTSLASGPGSLDTLLSNFFNDAEQLDSQPDDLAQRQVTLSAANDLTNGLNNLADTFQQQIQGTDQQLQQLVSQVNTLTPQIAALNGLIQQKTVLGIPTNDLSDQRGQLINQLAQLIDVRTISAGNDQVTVLGAGAPLVLGTTSTKLQYVTDKKSGSVVQVNQTNQALSVTGGQIGGLLQIRNQVLPAYQNQLDTLAQSLVRGLDEIHATGLGLNGPLTTASSQRPVSDPTVPLAQAGLAFPPQAGTLYISVTNQATGQRTLNAITIDPATQSLHDLASAISGISNLQAVVNTQTNTLNIFAKTGYGFDFAGRLATAPATSNLTGTSVQVGGTYSGTANDNFTFQVVGTGTIGVTPGLSLQVTNGAGDVVSTLNIGQGYSPGSALQAADGISVNLAAGTVTDGQTFTVQAVAQPDSAGILTALGLNTFFQGDKAGDLAVRPDLLANPGQFAASLTGQAGDAGNLQRILAQGAAPLLGNGTQTYEQFYAAMVGGVGGQVQELDQRQSANQAVGQNLSAQQQSISGVDPNEELVQMLQFQHSFQLSSRYIAAIDNTLSDLLTVVQ